MRSLIFEFGHHHLYSTRLVDIVHITCQGLLHCSPVRFCTPTARLAICQDEAREAKVLEKVVPNVTERSFATTSRVSPSQPSGVWLVVVA